MWRVALSLSNTEARPSGTFRTGSFIAKIEMAVGCRDVGGEEVGVKCGCMQGCYEGARPGVRSWQSMVQVAISTKTKKIGAAACALPRVNLNFCMYALREGVPP